MRLPAFRASRTFILGLVFLCVPALCAEPGVERPWVQGIGLHVEGGGKWRVQVMLPAVFLPAAPAEKPIPSALKDAPVPSVLLHFNHLRPGMQQLVDLSNGLPASLLPGASHGPRAGFYLRQAQDWLKNGKTVLEPLAQREAWVLHYGQLPYDGSRSRRGAGGTAVFIPGKLPKRNLLALELARVNPFSVGVRTQKIELPDSGTPPLRVEAIRGLGGVLYVAERPEGMWMFDRQAIAKRVLLGDKERALGSRPHWMSLAQAGCTASTEASLWILPRLAGSPDAEEALLKAPKSAAPAKPAVLSASPRSSALTLALGGGLPLPIVKALTEADSPFSLDGEEDRSQNRRAIQADLKNLLRLVNPETLNLSWMGWTQVLGKTDGDPGLTPNVAAAVPIHPGKGAEVSKLLRHLMPRLFEGKLETKKSGDVELSRIRTNQAFRPSWAVLKDTLVVGFSDDSVNAVVKGLTGEAPTLADAPTAGWGAAAVDGDRLASAMEELIKAYLTAFAKDYGMSPHIKADEVAAETASTFGPFFGVLKKAGKATLHLDWKPSGLEMYP